MEKEALNTPGWTLAAVLVEHQQAIAALVSQVREYRRYAQHTARCEAFPGGRCLCGLDDLNKAARSILSRYAPSEDSPS
jgi:hypothetical protein